MNDRYEYLSKNSWPEMTVNFSLYEANGKIYTYLYFWDGVRSYQTLIYDRFLIDREIGEEIIKKITEFILSDYDYISSFDVEDYRLSVDFKFDLTNDNGISCSKIKMIIEYLFTNNNLLFKHKYSKVFINNFLEYMKHTEFYKEAYNLYTSGFKSEYFDSLDDESLYKFVKQMDKDSLKELLKEMDFEKFLKIYNEMQEEYKDAPINRKLLK